MSFTVTPPVVLLKVRSTNVSQVIPHVQTTFWWAQLPGLAKRNVYWSDLQISHAFEDSVYLLITNIHDSLSPQVKRLN